MATPIAKCRRLQTRISRRPLLRIASALVCVLVALTIALHMGGNGKAWGQVSSASNRETDPTVLPRQSSGGGKVASLKAQLEKGLRARRAVEFQYIAEVIRLVETRKLPIKLVMETFHYARGKRSYPFQYFQRALSLRAAKIGVTIKPV